MAALKPANTPMVLVVEDEPMLLLVVAETLRESGFTVLEAGNGDIALDVLARNPEIDLLITDVRMPGMNGYQLTERSLELNPKLRVLLMTGYAQDAIPAHVAALRIPILYKPFDFDRLPDLANQVLSGSI